MGWDSWDTFGCGVTEQGVKQVANWMIATGMRDAGYRYVIIDDCWYDPTRTANGALRANSTKFPDGMRALGEWLHARGLLFGIYEAPQAKTCAQENDFYPGSTGSLGHEQQDADTFASWGVDYLLYDWCSPDGTLGDQIAAFTKMRNALRATGRPIVYSINPNSFHTPTGASYNWMGVANTVRVGPDLAPFWDTGTYQNWYSGVDNALDIDTPLAFRAGPGHWNDPDTLTVGLQLQSFAATVGSTGLDALLSPPLGVPDDALSLEEMQTNFAMWAMLAAPLIVGTNVRYLSPADEQILMNPGLIAIDQDPLGRQGYQINSSSNVWAKPLSGGSIAVALFNPTDATTLMTAYVSQLHISSAQRYSVTDVWTGREWQTPGPFWANVPAHGAAVFRVAPVPKAPPPRPRSTPPKSQPPHDR
jgi:alpha-galactosidase